MQGNKWGKKNFLKKLQATRSTYFRFFFFDVLLTVHLSIILVIKQRDAQNLVL